MADLFRLTGEYSALQSVRELGVPFPAEVLAQLAETMYLQDKLVGSYSLASDATVNVSLGSLAGAHIVIVRSTSKVRARLTSGDGAAQSIPVDPLLILLASASPVTAIDLTRLAGVNTEVTIFLGERA